MSRPPASKPDPEPTVQDEAARAGWLYYVGGMTQDQIAAEMGVSRQRAQRLVSRAMADGLIQVRLNHRIGACMDMERALRRLAVQWLQHTSSLQKNYPYLFSLEARRNPFGCCSAPVE